MPHVVIKMYPGTSEEQKKELVTAVTNSFINILNKPESTISVAIEEIDSAEWMNKVYEPEIRPIIEKLYKKPGY